MMEFISENILEIVLVGALLALCGFALYISLTNRPRLRNHSRTDRRMTPRVGSERRARG